MPKQKRKQGNGTVRQRKDGRWEGRIVVGYDEKGLPKTKNVLGKSKYECEQKLAALKETVGRLNERVKPEMKFGDWVDLWYNYYCKPALRPTTAAAYSNLIYKHIIPGIGKISLCRLTPSDIQLFYAKQKKEGRRLRTEIYGEGLSDAFVRNLHLICRSALEKAVKDKLIHTNVAIGCRIPPKKKREMQVLTEDEVCRFLEQAKAEGYFEMFLLELTTGMRRGEILGLKWSDLDFTTGALKIQRQISTHGESTPKTRASIRTVVLPPDLVEILSQLRHSSTCDWMFPSPKHEGQPRNPYAIQKRFKLILERSGCKNIRFHDLRHTFATMALENGMDVKTLSAVIGHVSAETTLDIYSHVTDTMREQASVRIDRNIGGTDAPMPEPKQEPSPPKKASQNASYTPYTPKIRKSGTGGIYQVNANLWEGNYYPRLPDGSRKKFNVYAKTRAEVEVLLEELVRTKKAEIAEMRRQLKAQQE